MIDDIMKKSKWYMNDFFQVKNNICRGLSFFVFFFFFYKFNVIIPLIEIDLFQRFEIRNIVFVSIIYITCCDILIVWIFGIIFVILVPVVIMNKTMNIFFFDVKILFIVTIIFVIVIAFIIISIIVFAFLTTNMKLFLIVILIIFYITKMILILLILNMNFFIIIV